MIPVVERPEPAGFDAQVRRKGLNWLAKRGVALDGPAPAGFEFQPYWRACLDELMESYGHICAYGGFRIERVTGARTVEHFESKSGNPGLAYEWSNFRLVCSLLNGRKRAHDDVLDPFRLEPETFCLELVSGKIYANPGLSAAKARAAESTIKRLGLDEEECRRRRREDFGYFVQREISRSHLERSNPFVYQEALRQGLL